jgi:hypothetical protein
MLKPGVVTVSVAAPSVNKQQRRDDVHESLIDRLREPPI